MLLWFLTRRLDFCLGNALVDLFRRPLPHLIGDMGVGVQRSGAGYMVQDGGQRFDIHPVCQGVGGEGMPKLVEVENGRRSCNRQMRIWYK